MRRGLSLLLVAAVALLVAASGTAEPRDSISRMFPIYNNDGKPDLTVDPQRFTAQMGIVDRVFAADSCEIAEGTVGAAGIRRILRFDVVLINGGQTITMGAPVEGPIFEFAECHNHYHIRNFADY